MRIKLVFLLITIVSCDSSFTRMYHYHQSARDTEEALELLKNELLENPSNADANFYMAELLMEKGSYVDAKPYFEKSLNSSGKYKDDIKYLNEKYYRVEFNRGIDLFKSKNYTDAIEFFKKSDHVIPNQAETFKFISSSYYELSNYAQSIQYGNRCVEVANYDYDCSLILVKNYFAMGNHDQAVVLAEEYVKYFRYQNEFLKAMIYASLEKSDYPTAEKKFGDYFKETKDYKTLKEFSLELFNKNQYEIAEPYLRNYYKHDPQDTDILRALSFLFLELRDYTSLVQVNERLVAIYPEDKSLKELLMLSYELIGDMDNYYFIKKQIDN